MRMLIFLGGYMEKVKGLKNYFSVFEIILWSLSVLAIVISFAIFDKSNYLTLCASLIGVTSLIFCAKGNPFGQILMIIFSTIYGIISFSFSYYGEMLTYMGMTLPMSVFSLVTWLKNPYKDNKAEVKVNKLKGKDIRLILICTAVVTVAFYFILKHFNTANLLPSTVSVTTSFIAAFLTFKRSPFFALGYATNDIVLIVLWVLATKEDISYISVVICFVVFLFNDLYGFFNWLRMQKRQGI
ncbi:MAG: nicotinamide mononucleotide transporter [Ruminococcaceae bacterium]|nr:nicotinamide mononucleotide transporter [Oscillospiraceae bacterium]